MAQFCTICLNMFHFANVVSVVRCKTPDNREEMPLVNSFSERRVTFNFYKPYLERKDDRFFFPMRIDIDSDQRRILGSHYNH